MISKILAFLNPNNCGHHHWGNLQSPGPHKKRRRIIERDGGIIEQKRKIKHCQHKGCEKEKTRWVDCSSIDKEDFYNLSDSEKVVARLDHIEDKHQHYYKTVKI